MRIIERFVKNNTPYLGKLVLRIEKEPDYENTKKGVLNEIHLNFGIFKLVTRLIPNIVNDGWELNPNTVPLIEKYTSCNVEETWITDNNIESNYRRGYILTKKNKGYVCDLKKGWWFYKNGIKISEEFPNCVGFKYENKEFKGYYLFLKDFELFIGIGDKIFEKDYRPSKSFHDPKKWKIWYGKYKKDLKKVNKETKKRLKKEGIIEYLPIQERGRYIIKNKEDAFIAVKNILTTFAP